MPLLGLLVLIPLVAALAVATTPAALPALRRLIAVGGRPPPRPRSPFSSSIDFDRDDGGLQFTESLDWAPARGPRRGAPASTASPSGWSP